MDIMATHDPIRKNQKHSANQAENSNAKCLLAILIGMVMWAILVLIATW